MCECVNKLCELYNLDLCKLLDKNIQICVNIKLKMLQYLTMML